MAAATAIAVAIVGPRRLAEGLITGIEGLAGTKMISEILGPSPPSFYAVVYKEIEKIVKKNLDDNVVSQNKGDVEGLLKWIHFTYNPRKDAGASKEELYRMLEPRVSDLAIKILGPLQEDRFAEAGLGPFLLAATLHLGLLQELAMVDPNVENYTQSSYIKTLKQYALAYADHAEQTMVDIEWERVHSISSVHAVGNPLNKLKISRWKDEFTDEKYTTLWTGDTDP